MRKMTTVLALVLGVSLASNLYAVEVDAEFPIYRPVGGISGNLKSVGSDTLNNLMTLWAEGFRAVYSNVTVEIEGKGSSTAPPALIQGAAHFGPMSREMKRAEMETFEERFGYKPSRIRVAIDALAVFVHKDNPVECLTLKQIDAMFSRTRRRGSTRDIMRWGDLGLTGRWADKPISLYGRNAASGTYGYFKKVVLLKGDYKDSVKEQPGSSAVVQGVASDRYGIGYSGIGYRTADVRTVPLAVDEGPCCDATAENAYRGDYPLARFLYLYLNRNPNEPLDPRRREFIRYIYSRRGQEIVIKAGYFPVSYPLARADMKAVGIE